MNKDDPRYEARKEYFQNKMDKKLDDVDSFEKKKKNGKHFQIYDKITDCFDPRKTKMVVKFNNRESASIISFAVRKRSEVKVTSHFMSGKFLFFAKLTLKNFIYEITETFCFPKENIIEIYKKYMIEKLENFHVLTWIVPP